MTRLNAPTPQPPPRPRRPSGEARCCLECGEPLPRSRPSAEFCAAPCRQVWNNRRLTRGAELYDLFMAWRYDRPAARALKVWRYLCRLAAQFRHEDRAARAGRRSWRPPAAVLAAKPWLQGKVLVRGRDPAEAASHA